MTDDRWPGRNEQQGRPGDDGGSLPPQWQYRPHDETQRLDQYGGQQGYGQGTRPYPPPGGDGRWQPSEWRHAQPGRQGLGPPPPQPPYQSGSFQQPPYQQPYQQAPYQQPYQPPYQQAPYQQFYRAPQRGKSWPARHKALTGIFAFIALIVTIVAANAAGSSSSSGRNMTAGVTTPSATASATASGKPSQHVSPAATVVPTAPPATAQATQAASQAPAPPAPAPTTRAPVPTATTATAVAPPPAAAAPAGCHPLTNGGKCYEPGEFCRNSDHGVVGLAGDGETITCADNDGWRWEPS